MPPADYSSLDADTTAALLGVSTRQLSTYVKDKRCPCQLDGRQRIFVWAEVLDWYVGYRASIDRSASPSGGPSADGDADDDPVRRKDAAVASLKELDLQQRRGQLVPMVDVRRVLGDVAKGLQTEILSLPTRITGPALALREQNALFSFLTAECKALCTRLAQLNLSAVTAAPPPDEPDPASADDDA